MGDYRPDVLARIMRLVSNALIMTKEINQKRPFAFRWFGPLEYDESRAICVPPF